MSSPRLSIADLRGRFNAPISYNPNDDYMDLYSHSDPYGQRYAMRDPRQNSYRDDKAIRIYDVMHCFDEFLSSKGVNDRQKEEMMHEFYKILHVGPRRNDPTWKDKPSKPKPLIAKVQFSHDLEDGFYIVYPPDGSDPLEYSRWKAVEELCAKESWLAEWVGDEQYKPKKTKIKWLDDIDEEEA